MSDLPASLDLSKRKFNKFQDVPRYTGWPGYAADVAWEALEAQLTRYADGGELYKLNLNPDFQRGHVWTRDQQIAFVQFKLRGGRSSSDILFNHPNWMGSFKGELVLVDGKQRLEAARAFLRDEIPAFGSLFSEYTDRMGYSNVSFRFHINNLKTRAELLNWYVELNEGGTPHTKEEIQKVKEMLEEEIAK